MFRVKAFDAVEAGFGHRRDDFIGMIQAGMRQHGHPAGILDQINCFGSGHFELGNKRRPILLEETLERFVETRAKARLNQRASDVRPARRAAVGEIEHGIGIEGNSERIEPSDDFANPILTDSLELLDFRQQAGMRCVNAIPENVDFMLLVLSR
jgi:hypothetical protein